MKVKVNSVGRGRKVIYHLHDRPAWTHYADRSEKERKCCDPKDGELYGIRTKSLETAMEVRKGSDVQIDPQNSA